MVDQPNWTKTISVDKFVELVAQAFWRKYSREMTRDGRRELRRVLNEELATLEDDRRYEHGTESPQRAADGFAELAAGELSLQGRKDFEPSPTRNTLDGRQKAGKAAIVETVSKARGYHRKNNGTCPVWPF